MEAAVDLDYRHRLLRDLVRNFLDERLCSRDGLFGAATSDLHGAVVLRALVHVNLRIRLGLNLVDPDATLAEDARYSARVDRELDHVV
jgi:hypothetical protein